MNTKVVQSLSKMAEAILGEGSAANKLRNRNLNNMNTPVPGMSESASTNLSRRTTETFNRQDFEMSKLGASQGGPAIKLLHPTITAEVSRVILKSVVNNILYESNMAEILSHSGPKLLSLLVKILKLKQSNEIYHTTLKLVREYPDHDLDIDAFEAILGLSISKTTPEIVKTDATKTLLTCLEKGSEKVGVNMLITISEMIGKEKENGVNSSHSFRLRIVLRTMFEYVSTNEDKKLKILNNFEQQRKSWLVTDLVIHF